MTPEEEFNSNSNSNSIELNQTRLNVSHWASTIRKRGRPFNERSEEHRTIWISKKVAVKLQMRKNRGESIGDVIKRFVVLVEDGLNLEWDYK